MGPTDLQLAGPLHISAGLIDRLRFSASNYLCIKLEYRKENGQTNFYLLEPYSLNETSKGFLLLHAIKHDTGQIRAFRTDRMISVEVTDTVFTPSYRIDLISHGPKRITQAPTQSRAVAKSLKPAQGKKWSSSKSGITYIVKCSLCEKKFRRKTMSGKLNKHKNKAGLDCSGRVGFLTETKY